MIIKTDKNETIKTTGPIEFNDMHRCFYVDGHRLIKSRGTFSTSELIHNFKSYVVEVQ